MITSKELSSKSVQAAISAIEIYNKPDFSYREESFSLLMVNAWELLLKAKWLDDHNENLSSLYLIEKDENGLELLKLNRCGNPITHSLLHLAAQLLSDPNSGLEKPCYDNLIALIEIRDNSVHFINKDIYFGRRILEIGTASLRNYLLLASEWFQIDLSKYNFFLMPISFYHGFESASPVSESLYPEQVKKLLQFLDSIQQEEAEMTEMSTQHVALRLETKFVKGKKDEAISFKWTDDPSAPVVTLREEDITKNYPLTYNKLTDALRRRYSNFIVNKEYHRLRREMEKENKYCLVRFIDPNNPNSTNQRFYNPNVFIEFDKHYEKRKKT